MNRKMVEFVADYVLKYSDEWMVVNCCNGGDPMMTIGGDKCELATLISEAIRKAPRGSRRKIKA
jgi:hypothetical protein